MSVIFRMPDNVGKLSNKELRLRLSPTSIQFEYDLNHQITNTYGGQVVQILSITFNQLIIQGQFGKEGPHGKFLNGKQIEDRSVGEYKNWDTTNKYGVGLVQMYTFFQEYFSIASQGYDSQFAHSFRYEQPPITLIYDGGIGGTVGNIPIPANDRTWLVYPVDFPSFSRSLEEFAPTWQVTCEVEQPDPLINAAVIQNDLDRLRVGIGYTDFNPYSDPLGAVLTTSQGRTREAKQILAQESLYNNVVNQVFDHYGAFLPNMSPSDIEQAIGSGGSFPQLFQQEINAVNGANTPSTGAYSPLGHD